MERTSLLVDVTELATDKLVAETKQFDFIEICVPPFWVKKVRREL